jgi:hypothetical protein
MLHLIAQATSYDYSSTSSAGATAGGAVFILLMFLVGLAVYALVGVSLWKLFEKAGRPGWQGIVPIYNGWVLAEIAGKPGWWGIVGIAGAIPLLGIFASIAAFVLGILIAIELAKCFGKDPAYAALIILLPIVGFPMLAFSDAKYTPPAHTGTPGATPPAPQPPTPAA